MFSQKRQHSCQQIIPRSQTHHPKRTFVTFEEEETYTIQTTKRRNEGVIEPKLSQPLDLLMSNEADSTKQQLHAQLVHITKLRSVSADSHM